jgi:hypothetical protein
MWRARRIGMVGSIAAPVLLAVGAAVWVHVYRLDELRLALSADEVARRAWEAPPSPAPPPPGGYGITSRWAEPVPRTVSSELPPWFGDARAAPIRIAGKVSGQGATTVRLAIAVPDPAIWTGREVEIGADGTFDFGPMRPGAYWLIAIGGERMSRLTRLDTIREPAARAELVVASCRWFEGAAPGRELFAPPGDAVPGLAVELTGRAVAWADPTGRWRACAVAREDLELRTAGHEVTEIEPGSRPPRHRFVATQMRTSGVVFEADGEPARHVGVQPIWRVPVQCLPEGTCVDASTIVTTDVDGAFSYSGWSTICGVRIIRGTSIQEVVYPPPDEDFVATPGTPSLTPMRVPHGARLIIRLATAHAPSDLERVGGSSQIESLPAPMRVKP